MLLRSGLQVGEIDKAESSSMDTSSTRAEPGSPNHTNSFSTTNSTSPLPLPPPPEASPSGSGQPQPQAEELGQPFHQAIPRPHGDFILYPAADEEEYADSPVSQEQVPVQHSPRQRPQLTSSSSHPTTAGASVQYNGSTPPVLQQNGNRNGTSSRPPPPQPLQTPRPIEGHAPLQTTAHQPSSEADSIQQWQGEGPWSPGGRAPGAAVPRVYPPHRSYPDKIEEELDELEKEATDTYSDEDEKKGQNKGKGKMKRGRKRRRHPSRSPATDGRDKRPRGGGDNGDGVVV
ncbi:hypothetical protein F5882DRAFT_8598 [Hyaloscypha sp. PMI_1271]|nr:hypothetical protein F5882DRAFT_8598 [Hyaloscypha sp. PMI_1271]